MDNNKNKPNSSLTVLTLELSASQLQTMETVLHKLKFVGLGIDEIIIDEPGLKGAKTIIMECVKDLESLLKPKK